MATEMDKERDWAAHMPSEGENPEHAIRQSSKRGVDEKVRSPEYQQAAAAAPPQADPGAAQSNKEFVEDPAMRYDEAEERFARTDKGGEA